jgi:hypothetical protein
MRAASGVGWIGLATASAILSRAEPDSLSHLPARVRVVDSTSIPPDAATRRCDRWRLSLPEKAPGRSSLQRWLAGSTTPVIPGVSGSRRFATYKRSSCGHYSMTNAAKRKAAFQVCVKCRNRRGDGGRRGHPYEFPRDSVRVAMGDTHDSTRPRQTSSMASTADQTSANSLRA